MGNYYAGMMNNTGGYGELKHHGILGQKWGVRRFQNADGSLTAAGRERYYGNDAKIELKYRLDKYVSSSNEFDKRKIKRLPQVKMAMKALYPIKKKYWKAQFDTHSAESAFYRDEELVDKYLDKVVKNELKDEKNKRILEEAFEGDMDSYKQYIMDEGDFWKPFELFLSEEPDHKLAKKYTENYNEMKNNWDELVTQSKNYLNEMIGDKPDKKQRRVLMTILREET